MPKGAATRRMIENKTLFFMHQNFPGQFLHLCRELAGKNKIYFITKKTANRIANVNLVPYEPHRKPNPETHGYLQTLEDAVLHGQGTARILLKLQESGIRPDIIVGHCGWGETLFVKDIFPDVPLLSYVEFYYSAVGADVGFDPAYPAGPETKFRLRCRNQMLLSCLEATDTALSPTWWQQSRFPKEFLPKIEVIHDGIDTAKLTPADNPSVTIGERTFDKSRPLVTFVARNLEPYRGFHVFMKAAELILQRHPTAEIVIVGGDEVSYGMRLPEGQTYRSRAMASFAADAGRIHFTGRIDYELFKRLLQTSDAHVYLTYPFVLSWSMLEAMATGCLVIGSRTQPVQEAIQHGANGLLVDFFDPEEIARTTVEALEKPSLFADIRTAARRTAIDRYDLHSVSLPRQKALLARMMA